LVSALDWAARGGNTQVVRMLLEAGDDIKEPPGRFEEVLHYAISSDRKEIALAMLNSGVNVNAYNGGALTFALVQAHEEFVQRLIAAGADVNAGNGWPICYASDRGQEAVVRVLVEAGADVNLMGDGQPMSMQAASCLLYMKITEMFIVHGIQLTGPALRCASARGHEGVARVLIEAGASVDLKGGKGETTLQVAVRSGRTKIVQMLVTAGAQVDSGNGWALRIKPYRFCLSKIINGP
jgi:ankyrin repeat protein